MWLPAALSLAYYGTVLSVYLYMYKSLFSYLYIYMQSKKKTVKRAHRLAQQPRHIRASRPKESELDSQPTSCMQR